MRLAGYWFPGCLVRGNEKDEGGNVKRGDVHIVNGENNPMYANDRLAVGIDVDDLIIADTADALLVAKRLFKLSGHRV